MNVKLKRLLVFVHDLVAEQFVDCHLGSGEPSGCPLFQ
jgi:hypothetical protein